MRRVTLGVIESGSLAMSRGSVQGKPRNNPDCDQYRNLNPIACHVESHHSLSFSFVYR